MYRLVIADSNTTASLIRNTGAFPKGGTVANQSGKSSKST